MICDFCHEREAVIFVTQVNGSGQKRRINMCMECAIANGISSDQQNIEPSVENLFNELTEMTRKLEIESNRMCPVCGKSIAEIRKTGRAGCPECYAIFSKQIQGYLSLKGMAVPESYTGSMPARLAAFHSVLNDRIALQNKLNDAVAHEDYEKAALYRDYLHALEKPSVSGDDESNGTNISSQAKHSDADSGGAL